MATQRRSSRDGIVGLGTGRTRTPARSPTLHRQGEPDHVGNLDDVWPCPWANSSSRDRTVPNSARATLPLRSSRRAGLTCANLGLLKMWVGEGGGRVLDYPSALSFVKHVSFVADSGSTSSTGRHLAPRGLPRRPGVAQRAPGPHLGFSPAWRSATHCRGRRG